MALDLDWKGASIRYSAREVALLPRITVSQSSSAMPPANQRVDRLTVSPVQRRSAAADVPMSSAVSSHEYSASSTGQFHLQRSKLGG